MSGQNNLGSRIVVFILSLTILLGVVSSCSLVQQSQEFEKIETEPVESNLDILPDQPPVESIEGEEIGQTSYFIPADPVELGIQKGTVPTFTGKGDNKSPSETDPTADLTPTPTPRAVPILDFGSGSARAPYTIRVFLDKQRIIVYGTNSEGQEVPIRSMVTSTGVRGKSTPQTGENGYFSLGGGSRWVRFNLINKNKPTYHQYARQFTGTDINGNSIGRNYFFHSTTYTVARDPSSLDRATYNKLGNRASSGCIRLNVADARYIYGLPRGTKVKVLASSSGYNLKVNGLPKYTISKSEHNGWDPYDPDPKNRFGKIVFTAPSISGPVSLELKEGYAATETAAFKVGGDPAPEVEVSGNKSITWDKSSKKLKIAKGLTEGTYEVTLTATSSAGKADTTFTLTVTPKDEPTPSTGESTIEPGG